MIESNLGKIIEREMISREKSLGKSFDDKKKEAALSKAGEYEKEIDRMAEKVQGMVKDVSEILDYELRNQTESIVREIFENLSKR